MVQYPFIFSNESKYRVQRHVLFWVGWWLFQSFLYSFSAGMLGVNYFQRLPVSMVESFAFLLQHIFLAYTLIYWVLPRFLLKGKYLETVFAVICLFIVTGFLSALTGRFVIGNLRFFFLNRPNRPEHVNEVSFFLGLLAGLRGGITIGGMAAAIKLMKYWYVKEQRNLQLQKENITTQLQLLKAQVHPHFLFNTLNNIYSSAQVTAPDAARMIVSLSGLLRYMLHDCSQPLVPLSKELQMLQEYMELEKSRYGNGLDTHMEFPAAESGLYIAPLVLLPFVENSFKHGASHVLEQPWISLHISLDGEWLKMKLLNGKTEASVPSSSGIGLTNVKQRLQLLYPDRHELSITVEGEVFIVNLKLLLEQPPASVIPVKDRITVAAYE